MCAFAPTASAITQTDAVNILFLKQEEKLARDVYQNLYAKWGHMTFKNIAVSEQRHMNAVDGLIVRYNLTDTTPAGTGKFSIPEIQALYVELIEKGNLSLEDALEVGVAIEEMDIADIKEMLAATKERAISRVLNNLLQGSFNHLAAFENALEQLAASPATSATTTCGSTCGSCQAVCTPVGKGQRQQRRP
jgi:hypothetical protein